eukprot:TRINITY_DN1740_c0_g1_i3.p1 TRINITY_DN1740_c0_g1~~TRINITY_DN1740_c0_g1_i3.p1  ORF type:complete len:354 (-),score=34.83 TRINITY_DN1740_c0_g1_i3:1-1062(-)
MNLDQDKWIDWPSVGKFLSEEDAAEVACVSHLFARAFHLKKVRVTRWSSICEMLPLLEQAGCQSVHVEDECDALPEELVMLRSLTALNLTLSSQISDPRGVGASIQSLSKLQHLSLYLDENFEEFVDGLTGTHNQIPLFPQLESLHLTLRGVVNSASSIEQLRRLLESFSQYEDAHASPASITSLHTALLSLDSLVHLDFDLSSHMDQTRLFWDLMLDVCVAQPNLNSLRLRLVDCCLDTRALDVMIDSWVHGINRFGRPLAYLEHLELLVGGMNFSVFDMAYRAKLESLPLIPDVALELMEEPSIIIDNIEYYWGYDVCSDFLDEKKMNHRLAFALRTRTQEMKIDFEDPQY